MDYGLRNCANWDTLVLRINSMVFLILPRFIDHSPATENRIDTLVKEIRYHISFLFDPHLTRAY